MKSILGWSVVMLAFLGLALGEEAEANRLLRALYDRCDLIVDATLVATCEGGIATGPIPTAEAQLYYLSCTPRVTINRVLKGECPIDKPIYLGVTVPLLAIAVLGALIAGILFGAAGCEGVLR